ncbi:RYamide receptor-like [Dendronephthya gigantea]|uniref:RYamide receptor-like n=1 Tax=Dendronephthya gigantea TaxID=151771 RepID=UPI00106C98E1|nr:RYamide receptor-like [Dendronephthya gigantea]
MMSFGSNFTRNELTLNACLVSYIVESPTEVYIDSTISACVINAILLIIGFAMNSLVVVIFATSKQLRSKLTFLPILVLCSVDLATVSVVHPLFLIQAIAEVQGSPDCVYKIAYFSALYIFPGMSATTLLIMNVERYIAIVWPLWHLRISGKKQKFMLACVLFWLVIAANVACRLYKPAYSKPFTTAGVSMACLITLFIYVSMFQVARTRRSKLEASGDIERDSNKGRQNLIHDLKIAKMYFLVVVLSFICYLPIGIVVFATKYPWRENEARRTLLAQVYMWANTFISMNSTLNCLVFFWANARLRREGLKLWQRLFKSVQTDSRGSSESI